MGHAWVTEDGSNTPCGSRIMNIFTNWLRTHIVIIAQTHGSSKFMSLNYPQTATPCDKLQANFILRWIKGQASPWVSTRYGNLDEITVVSYLFSFQRRVYEQYYPASQE